MQVKRMKLVELTNGRAAMFGCTFIGLSAIAVKANLLEMALSQDLQSIWWALGIYA